MAFPLTPKHEDQVREFMSRNRVGTLTILFTDIVKSVDLKRDYGDPIAVLNIQRHHALVRDVLRQFPEGEEIETAGDSFLIIFTKPSDAVKFSLLLQARLRELADTAGIAIRDRIGIHAGEVFIEEQSGPGATKNLFGMQVDTAARVMSLAGAGQTLMTRFVFDNARQVLKGQDLPGIGELLWLSHGPYLLKGVEEPLDICEAGEVGKAPLKPPGDSEKAHRYVSADGEPVLGWRPAREQTVPRTQWELTEKLGEGGFGEVWLARHKSLNEARVFKFCFRVDRVRSLKREVTLFRVLKERVGEHPRIVRLMDIYFEEPPFYLEMEYVPGRDLATWAEEQGGLQNVPLETRLEIAAQVADALQAAHDCGVIHRDVKPSNILISSSPERRAPARLGPDSETAEAGSETGAPACHPSPALRAPSPLLAGGERDGVRGATASQLSTPHPQLSVKLTDFGIGQIVSDEALGDLTKAGFTQTMLGSTTGSYSGTRLYMAPELLAGQKASPRSDIYSLGVVLYQLATGDLGRPLTTDWARHIPDPLLREDLEQCFAGDPGERVTAASLLAKNLRSMPARQADLERQRSAQKERERAAYRKGVMRTAALAAVAVAAFAALAWYAFDQADKARDAAKSEALQKAKAEKASAAAGEALAIAKRQQKLADDERNMAVAEKHRADDAAATAQAVTDFLKHDLLRQASSRDQANTKHDADPNLTVRQALDRAAKSIGSRFQTRPLVEAAIRNAIGNAMREVGEYEKAVEHLDRALELQKAKLGPEHPDTLISMGNLAGAYRAASRLNQAVPLFEETLKLRKAKLGPEHTDTLDSMNGLAWAYQAADKLDQALPLFEQTLKLARAKLGPEHPISINSMQGLAWAYQAAGKLDLALPLNEETLKLRKAKLGPEHPDTLNTMTALAWAYQAAGKLDLALPLNEETLKLRKAKLGPEHPDTLSSMNNLAGAYKAAGKLDQALPLLEETLKLRKAKLGPEHSDTLYTMNGLASAYQAANKLDQALPLYEETLKLRKAKLGPEHSDTLVSMNGLAYAYYDAGKLDPALSLFEETLKLRKTKLGPEHPDTLNTMIIFASAYRAAGKLDQALPLYEETLKLQKAKLGPEHPSTLTSMNNLAEAYRAAGKLDQALPLYEETLKLQKTKLGPEHPDTLQSMNNLASAYYTAGKLDQALPLLEETLKLRKAKLGPEHPSTLISMNNLASAYRAAGKLDQALPLYEETLKLRKAKLGPEHPDTLYTMAGNGVAYIGAKRYADAEPLLIAAQAGLNRPENRASAAGRAGLRLSLQGLVRLYDEWGQPAKAAEWRRKLAEFK